MARRSAAEKNLRDLPLTLQKAFEVSDAVSDSGERIDAESPAEVQVG